MKTSEPVVLAGDDVEGVKRLAELLETAQRNGRGLRLTEDGEGRDGVVVPEGVVKVMRSAVAALGGGEAAVVTAVPQELQLADAAWLLNVSREYVGSLVQEGTLSLRQRPGGARLRLEEVLRVRAQRNAERRATLSKMVEESEAAGGYPEFSSGNGEDETPGQ